MWLLSLLHLGFLGTFCPAFDEEGKYLLNRWNEIKFVAPDGMHRCAAQVRKNLQLEETL